MGIKGDKAKAESAMAVELIVEKLASIGNITSKRMFGGAGLFHDGKMFGMVNSNGKYFFKAKDAHQEKMEAAGAIQHSKMPYFSVPDKVLNDLDELLAWAKSSIELSK